MTLAIDCRNLHKTYPGKPPVEAVRGLDLAVETGECFGLLGPNGAGKTTTIEILEGLLAPSAGQVEVLGQTWGTDDRMLKARLGIALQETKLPEKLTVSEVVELFRSFYPRGPAPREVLSQVSLQEKARTQVRHLSGGQRQRLGVACALVGDPELLFLDEPTTGLDPTSRRQLWDLVRGFRQRGRTVLLTTHYMDEAERLCDRVAIVDQGRVIACDTPRQLIARLGGEHIIEFSLTSAHCPADAVWAALPSVEQVRHEAGHVQLTCGALHVALPALLEAVATSGSELASLTSRVASLEDVFVSLTGRHLSTEESAAA